MGQQPLGCKLNELRSRISSWPAMRQAVCNRFDHDQYQIYLCQLDSLRQTGSVAEYYEKFEQLSHSVLLYNSAYDDTYFVTRFLVDYVMIFVLLLHCIVLPTSILLVLLHFYREKNWPMGKSSHHLERNFATATRALLVRGILLIKASPKLMCHNLTSTHAQINWSF